MRKHRVLILLSIFCLLLSGCTEQLLQEQSEVLPLPSLRPAPIASLGDVRSMQQVKQNIYVPDFSQGRLVVSTEEITVEAGQSLAEPLLRRLLDRLRDVFPGMDGQELRLLQATNAVEETEELITVNLAVSTNVMSKREQFFLGMAITNTLTELDGIHYVDVLVNGRDEGIDLLATIPCGVLTRYSSGDILSRWAQEESQAAQSGSTADFRKITVLYYPTADGHYLLPEIRTVTFQSYEPKNYLDVLLGELAKDSTKADTCTILPPAELGYMLEQPEIISMGGSAVKLVRLSFLSAIDSYQTVMGGNRAVFFASLTYTLAGFIPGVDGVIIAIDGEPVLEVIGMDGQSLHFAEGVMTRDDFAGIVANQCTLYFPARDGSGLVAVRRPVDQQLSTYPRTLLEQLLLGPQPFDSRTDILPVFPDSLSEADILGITLEGDAALVNVSEEFAKTVHAQDRTRDRDWIYSMVNTLTELRGIRSVWFYVEGEQLDFLGGAISTQGEFLRHPGLIVPSS